VREAEARELLDRLASRAILLDLERHGTPLYMLPPPMAGFFEFSMMRLRGDVDQKRLAELFYLTLGNTARSLAKHGFARAIDAAEGLDLLQRAQDEGLAQFGENVRERPPFICNCCGSGHRPRVGATRALSARRAGRARSSPSSPAR
jgi:hypothetical protein